MVSCPLPPTVIAAGGNGWHSAAQFGAVREKGGAKRPWINHFRIWKAIMGSLSIWHWLIVLFIALLFFGNRLPQMMGDFGKGIRNFKSGLNEAGGDAKDKDGAKALDAGSVDAAKSAAAEKDTVAKG